MLSRQDTIKQFYTDIQLSPAYFDLYIVRRNILAAVESNLHLFKGNILDVGCGIMPYKEIILDKNKNVSSYTGVDFESPVNDQYSILKPDMYWDGKTIPMADNSVETVIATEVFEHCADPELVMKEILRVLKKDGILFFTVPFFWYLHLVPYDEYRYTPFALKRHLTNSGFRDIQIYQQGGWDASLAQMISLWYSRRPLSGAKRKILYAIFKPLVKYLMKKDPLLPGKHEFRDGDMVTGLFGTAYK